jgi:hypothetical protein
VFSISTLFTPQWRPMQHDASTVGSSVHDAEIRRCPL